MLEALRLDLAAFFHGVAHVLHVQRGRVVSAYNQQGTLFVGYKCSRCGKVTGISAVWAFHPDAKDFQP